MQKFNFELKPFDYFIHQLKLVGLTFLSFFTLGIALPWVMVWHNKWYYEHVTLEGKKLVYTGEGLELLKELVIVMLLTLVTLGIYSFWSFPRMQKWHWERTHIAE